MSRKVKYDFYGDHFKVIAVELGALPGGSHGSLLQEDCWLVTRYAYARRSDYGRLSMAVHNRDVPDNALIHFDRGVQYRSNRYQALVRDYGFKSSMSRREPVGTMLYWNHFSVG